MRSTPEKVAARILADRGLTRVLIEGGGDVAAAFLKADLIDEIAWFRSNTVIGGDGKRRGRGARFDRPRSPAQPGFTLQQTLVFGPDTLDILSKA